MTVLVDTSVWIDYFRGGMHATFMDQFIDENLIATNDLILAELIPFLKMKKEHRLIELLGHVRRLDLTIDWNKIIEDQFLCLKSGLNGVGLPDLMIAQNAKENSCHIYSLDKHFFKIKDVLMLSLVEIS